jgi:hypothetical protein
MLNREPRSRDTLSERPFVMAYRYAHGCMKPTRPNEWLYRFFETINSVSYARFADERVKILRVANG